MSPQVDFTEVKEIEEFKPLPKGKYHCRIADVEELKPTKNGDPMWRIRLLVVGGKHDGRAIYDNLVFSEAALPRLKHVCSSLGLDVSGKAEVTPDLLEGREVVVNVTLRRYEDAGGQVRRANCVPFAGYEPLT